MDDDNAIWPAIEPIGAGLRGRCPRCGQGQLFSGFLTVARNCTNCRQDYAFAEAGDGPAVLVILLAGFVVVGLALWIETSCQPPLWLHFILWVPLAIALCLAGLRLMKGVLITLQFRNGAAEGRLDRTP